MRVEDNVEGDMLATGKTIYNWTRKYTFEHSYKTIWSSTATQQKAQVSPHHTTLEHTLSFYFYTSVEADSLHQLYTLSHGISKKDKINSLTNIFWDKIRPPSQVILGQVNNNRIPPRVPPLTWLDLTCFIRYIQKHWHSISFFRYKFIIRYMTWLCILVLL